MNAAAKTYVKELSLATLLYVVVLVISLRILNGGTTAWWRIPVAVAPVLPALLMLRAILLARIDELQRRIQLEALAFGFAASALLTFTYGFLQNVGFPQINWVWVWPVMAVTWVTGLLIANRKYR